MQRGPDLETGNLGLAQVGKQGPHPLDPLRRRQVGQAELGGIVEIGEDGQVLEQQIILGDVAEDAGYRGGFAVDVAAVEEEGAVIWSQGAVEDIE